MLDLEREYVYMKDDIDSAIKGCLLHQNWILGPELRELEKRIAVYIGVKYCIGVSSGTEALLLALRAVAISRTGKEFFDKEDYVITTPLTFTATGDAILRSGATPVFVDIDPVTFSVDPMQIRDCIAKYKHNIVGIVPVHLYGRPCEMDCIIELADQQNLFIVEDVAQAFGGMWRNKKLGSLHTAGAFSFFPSKNLGCFGDGGMIATNDDNIFDLASQLLKHGGKDKFNVDHVGYNARLDTIQAAVLLSKLKYVDEFNNRRRAIAKIYNDALKNIGGIILPAENNLSAYHVYHQYTIRVLDGKRDDLQRHLKEMGIDSAIYYPVPLQNMKVFKERSKTYGNLTNAITACSEILSLPIEPLYEKDELQYVIGAILNFLPHTQ